MSIPSGVRREADGPLGFRLHRCAPNNLTSKCKEAVIREKLSCDVHIHNCKCSDTFGHVTRWFPLVRKGLPVILRSPNEYSVANTVLVNTLSSTCFTRHSRPPKVTIRPEGRLYSDGVELLPKSVLHSASIGAPFKSAPRAC